MVDSTALSRIRPKMQGLPGIVVMPASPMFVNRAVELVIISGLV